MRDHTKLRVFALSDELVVEVYRRTERFPSAERYGLQSQVRRASVSVPTNIVEGCTRASTRDFAHFVTIALGSASEVRYLLSLAARLEILPAEDASYLEPRCEELVKALSGLVSKLRAES